MNPELHRVELIRNRRHLGERVLLCLVLFWFFLLILIPLFGIVKETFSQGLAAVKTSLATPASLHAFWLTILLTTSAVILNTLFGTILAVVLARQNFKGKLALESLLDLPFAVSPVVAGFMLIILFGSKGWIGSWFSSMNIKIIYAFPGMLMATLFVTLPFVAREILPVLREFGPEQEEAASTLGASQWQTFWRITLPTIKWGLAYGVTLTIARSIGEFGAVLVVSGSIINKTQTATLRIHDQFADFNYAGAFSAAFILIVASFLLLNFIKYIYKTKGGNTS
ncbi:MAG: sulfate ABC transporter permease subunit [Candidatus Aminicenantes bacterium]|nr:sulfate ABC transporter permease subunit [Candidatus Aminicenantes bacterium]